MLFKLYLLTVAITFIVSLGCVINLDKMCPIPEKPNETKELLKLKAENPTAFTFSAIVGVFVVSVIPVLNLFVLIGMYAWLSETINMNK